MKEVNMLFVWCPTFHVPRDLCNTLILWCEQINLGADGGIPYFSALSPDWLIWTRWELTVNGHIIIMYLHSAVELPLPSEFCGSCTSCWTIQGDNVLMHPFAPFSLPPLFRINSPYLQFIPPFYIFLYVWYSLPLVIRILHVFSCLYWWQVQIIEYNIQSLKSSEITLLTITTLVLQIMLLFDNNSMIASENI